MFLRFRLRGLDLLGGIWTGLDLLGIYWTEFGFPWKFLDFIGLKSVFFQWLIKKLWRQGACRGAPGPPPPGLDPGLDPEVAWRPLPRFASGKGEDIAGAGAAGGWQSRRKNSSRGRPGRPRTASFSILRRHSRSRSLLVSS
jgi:hypothetical protein